VVAWTVLAGPAVYLAAGYGPGTAPVAAYLTGLVLGALRVALAVRGRL
jgi:hypothetical protein